MRSELPAFARYVALVMFLQTPEPAAARAPAKPRAPRRKWTEDDKLQFAQLRDAGVSIGKAAARLDVPLGTAKFWEEQRKGNR